MRRGTTLLTELTSSTHRTLPGLAGCRGVFPRYLATGRAARWAGISRLLQLYRA